MYQTFGGANIDTLSYQINTDLVSLLNNACHYMLYINPSKSSVILFCNKAFRNTVKNNLIIEINNTVVPLMDSSKGLGICTVICDLRNIFPMN